MNDRGLSVLEQYEIKVTNTRKGRGAVICETEQGMMILRELTTSRKKIDIQGRLLQQIDCTGRIKADKLVKNKEDSFVSYDRDETPYVLKEWFDGKECDAKSEQEVLAATRNLAKLHNIMCSFSLVEEEKQGFTEENLIEEFERHNRELKKVRTFIRNKRRKSEFEIKFTENFNYFFEQGEKVLEQLKASAYAEIAEVSYKKGLVCHGDYNHHNIIMMKREIATTNFERSYLGVQIADLYHFMRKIMEKHNWNQIIGRNMLDQYRSIRPIENEELYHLSLRLSYPEKFWKIANHYYNTNKAWIPGKNIEKLEALASQNKAREYFLAHLF